MVLAGLEVDHGRAGMRGTPGLEGRHFPAVDVPERPTGMWAADRRRGHLRPEGLVRPIEEQHVRQVDHAGDTEFEDLTVEATIENGHRVAERAIGDRQVGLAQVVVDQLVPVEHIDRIGPRDAVNRQADHPATWFQEGCLGDKGRGGVRQALKPSLGRRLAEDLVQGYGQVLHD